MSGRMMLGAAALVMSLAIGVEVQGQGRGHGGQRGAGQGEMRGGDRRGPMMAARALLRGIDLTDAQKTKIRDIALKYRPRHEAFADTMRANRELGIRPDSTQLAKRMQILAQERAEIRAVLTAEQQKTFDANVAKMQDRMKERRDNPRGPGRGR